MASSETQTVTYRNFNVRPDLSVTKSFEVTAELSFEAGEVVELSGGKIVKLTAAANAFAIAIEDFTVGSSDEYHAFYVAGVYNKEMLTAPSAIDMDQVDEAFLSGGRIVLI